MHTTATVRLAVHPATSTAVNNLQMPLQARVSSLALAAVLTLAMLAGVDTLATGDNSMAPQMAQTRTTHA